MIKIFKFVYFREKCNQLNILKMTLNEYNAVIKLF